jgi:hypothetical protein
VERRVGCSAYFNLHLEIEQFCLVPAATAKTEASVHRYLFWIMTFPLRIGRREKWFLLEHPNAAGTPMM